MTSLSTNLVASTERNPSGVALRCDGLGAVRDERLIGGMQTAGIRCGCCGRALRIGRRGDDEQTSHAGAAEGGERQADHTFSLRWKRNNGNACAHRGAYRLHNDLSASFPVTDGATLLSLCILGATLRTM